MEQIKLADFDLSIALLANGFMIGIHIEMLMLTGTLQHCRDLQVDPLGAPVSVNDFWVQKER